MGYGPPSMVCKSLLYIMTYIYNGLNGHGHIIQLLIMAHVMAMGYKLLEEISGI